MPVVGISVRRLQSRLGQEKSVDDLVDVLECLGCDVDETATVALYRCPTCQATVEVLEREGIAPRRCPFCGHEAEAPFEQVGTDEVVRLDLLPARPDLFDPGGLARSIKGYLGIETGLPATDVEEGRLEVTVDRRLAEESSYRPFIACAELTVPPLDEEGLRDLMKLQENLHWAIGRDRKLASIGVYDLARIEGPIAYRAAGPEELEFAPLGLAGRRMTPRQILESHPKGVAYAHLLESYAAYPLLVDAGGQVLSMPPIINSEETKVVIGSTDLFVDVTGITRSDVERALNTLVSSLVETGATVRSVRIVEEGAERRTPDLEPRSIELSLSDTNRWLGLDLSAKALRGLLERMRLSVEGGPEPFTVRYPAFRTDFKHEVDVMEDVIIAYGYRNLDLSLVPTATVGVERPEEILSARVRTTMLGLGFAEIMTLMQETEADHFTRLRLPTADDHVLIGNPKSVELNRIRRHLMSGLLAILDKNKHKPTPVRFFEVGNVVHLDPDKETGTTEIRRLAFLTMGPEAGYAPVRSVLDAVLHELGWSATYAPIEHPSFLPGRVATVDCGEGRTATIGEVHPEVVVAWGLPHPIALVELDLAVVI